MANEKKTDAIAEVPNTGLAKGELEAIPAYLKKKDGEAKLGMEDMSKTDVLIPRLALAQLQSPECTEGDPKCVPGLTAGDMFNSMTKQNYGREVFVQIIRKDPPRAMEFFPIDDGGGVADPDVPMRDPRLKWGKDGEKPVATEFRDYIAVILPSREIISLSFKSSGIKVAKQLNGLSTMRNADIFAGRYRLTTGQELKPKPYKVWLVENAGWVSESDAALARELYSAVKDLGMAKRIDREGGVGDSTGVTYGPNGEAIVDADIPF